LLVASGGLARRPIEEAAKEEMTREEKEARLKDLLREAFALVNELTYVPNVRSVGILQTPKAPDTAHTQSGNEHTHYENLALLADHPKPGPLPPIGPPLQPLPEAPQEVE
jgi:hypothetical protein